MAGIHKTFLKRAVSSQRLRAVVVDYEVLCKSTVASAPTTRSTLRATILGEDDAAKKDKHGNDDDVALHDKLVDEMQRKPSLKSAAKVKDPLALEDVASDDSSVRAKYLAKMNALKQRAKLNAVMADSRSDDISSISSVPSPEPAPVAPTKHDDVAPADMTNDLPKRKVNEHTNVFLVWNAKPQLNLREYGTALTKVAKLKYTANPRTVARLVGDIDAFRKRTQLDSFADVVDGVLYDPLRLKLMKPAPLCVLEAYSNVIEQIMASVTSTFAVSHTSATSSSDSSTSSSMVLPQFVEALCRVAQTLHGKLLDDNHGSIRNTIDTCRLEHSIKVMFDTMQVLPNGTTVKSASHVPQQQVQSNLDAMLTDIQSHMGTLSLRTRKVLQRRADDLNYICVLYFMVQINDKYVLDTDASLFFILARGNIYDSRQRDLDALQTYAEALAIAESLPESHPGRALALSCLGSVCYYAGNMLVALKCFDKALTLRESLFGEEHVDTATSLNNLACCLHAMGEVDAAAMFFRSVLHVFKLGFGLAHPRVSVAMKNLDTAQRHQSRLIQDRAHVKNRDDMKHIIAGL
ncbi:hypothetical protein DYB31_004291 [Aphanomyces astaci]|uniref:Kinesin light chain n=1 Tax=Aphanomyces astaci TaxID=112090 RepID=A0A397FA23_APHAT|nr:hypothetical protein DYB31_004291 [Aphanomyces astaci]